MIVLWIVLAVIVVFLAVLLLRAAAFKPHETAAAAPEPLAVDGEKAVRDLAAMVRCRTVSDIDRAKEDQEEFDKFYALLPTLFPNVYGSCTLEQPNDRSLLFRWKGKNAEGPTVLMAHYDVVSVVEEDWSKPAFEGHAGHQGDSQRRAPGGRAAHRRGLRTGAGRVFRLRRQRGD